MVTDFDIRSNHVPALQHFVTSFVGRYDFYGDCLVAL